MKRINFFLTVFVAAFSILGSADTNTVLIKYFEKVYSEEKNKFLNCVKDEDRKAEMLHQKHSQITLILL